MCLKDVSCSLSRPRMRIHLAVDRGSGKPIILFIGPVPYNVVVQPVVEAQEFKSNIRVGYLCPNCVRNLYLESPSSSFARTYLFRLRFVSVCALNISLSLSLSYSEMEPVASAVDKLKEFAKSTQDFANGAVSHWTGNPNRRNPVLHCPPFSSLSDQDILYLKPSAFQSLKLIICCSMNAFVYRHIYAYALRCILKNGFGDRLKRLLIS